jgi:hypothetical protein
MRSHDALLEEILEERVVSSRNRSCPRGVKRKMSSYPVRLRGSKPSHPINWMECIKILK